MRNDELCLTVFVGREFGQPYYKIQREKLEKAVLELSNTLLEKYNIDIERILVRYNSGRRGPYKRRYRRRRC